MWSVYVHTKGVLRKGWVMEEIGIQTPPQPQPWGFWRGLVAVLIVRIGSRMKRDVSFDYSFDYSCLRVLRKSVWKECVFLCVVIVLLIRGMLWGPQSTHVGVCRSL